MKDSIKHTCNDDPCNLDVTDENIFSSRFTVKSLIKGIVGIAFSVVLIIFLMSYISIDTLSALVKNAGVVFLFTATVFYLGTYYFRALRFKLMFVDTDPGLGALFSIVSLHSLFNHMMPFRTGEISYLYLQKRYLNTSYDKAGAMLIIARLFDLAALFLWALILLPAFFIKTDNVIMSWTWPVLSLILLILVLLIEGGKEKSKQLSGWLLKKVPSRSYPDGLIQRIVAFVHNTLTHTLDITRNVSLRSMLSLSMAFHLFSFLYFFSIIRTFGLKIRFLESIIPAYGASFAMFIPFNGLGSIGTFEAGMSLGQIGIGTEGGVSVSLAFLAHVHLIIIALAMSAAGYLYLRICSHRKIT